MVSGVAAAMIEKFRADAPIASLIGEPATPNIGDEVHLTFEGQTYKVAIVDKEAIVSGGEPDRLLAFFDAQDQLNVVSTTGTIGKSTIDVLVDNSVPDNVDVARRLGLMDGLTQVATRYSDESLVVEGTGSSSQANTIKLTFSGNDTYNLRSFSMTSRTAARQRHRQANQCQRSNGCRRCVCHSHCDQQRYQQQCHRWRWRRQHGSVASATAVGKVVTLTVNDGTKVEILRDGNTLSTGAGKVTVNPVTSGALNETLDDAYVSPGYELVRDGNNVSGKSPGCRRFG